MDQTQNKEIKHSVVDTYAEDMAKVIEDDKSGIVKKIIHGEEEHEKEKRNSSPESKKNRFFMFMGFVLILIAMSILSFFLLKKNANTVPVEQQFIPLVFNDQSTFLEISSLNKDQISQTILNAVNETSVKNGGMNGIYLTENKKIIGLRRFFSLIESNFVPSNDTLAVSDNFLLGDVNNDTKDFFILLKTRSTPDIFNSLRAWENKMFSDLHGFFGVDISADTNYLLTKNFTDGVIENKNARILYDTNGNIVLMYIFADENSIIITNTDSAAREIMLRLAASRVKK